MKITHYKDTALHAAKMIREVKRKGRWVFVCGNGGSSATAEHFSNDLFSAGVKSMCLSSNSAITTMLANDYGYDLIYEQQVRLFANKDDIVFLISVSGESKNILNAFFEAIEKKCKTISLTGYGLKTHFVPDCSIVANGDSGDPGIVENAHMMECHYIAHLVGEK